MLTLAEDAAGALEPVAGRLGRGAPQRVQACSLLLFSSVHLLQLHCSCDAMALLLSHTSLFPARSKPNLELDGKMNFFLLNL